MDYTRFDRWRRPLWESFAKRLSTARQAPRQTTYEELERLAVDYRQVLHDRALAASRFPGTALEHRLDRLVIEGTHFLQRDTGDHLPSPRRFVTEVFPAAMRRTAPMIGLLAAVFVTAVLFGFTMAAVEPALGLSFLGPDALADLENQRLWTESIFSVTPGSVSSSLIATNNLSVALTGWAGGMLLGLGALYVALLNGLMLGAVFATTARFSMAGELGEFVAAHGPLELTLIVVSAAAGMGVGRAVIAAGDEPRLRRVEAAARDALVVLLGSLPFILLLGFVEGFISPAEDIPLLFKVSLGLALEAFFLFLAYRPQAGRETFGGAG